MTTLSGTLISIPLTTEEQEAQIKETLERIVVERHAPNVPYLEGWVCLGSNYNRESWRLRRSKNQRGMPLDLEVMKRLYKLLGHWLGELGIKE